MFEMKDNKHELLLNHEETDILIKKNKSPSDKNLLKSIDEESLEKEDINIKSVRESLRQSTHSRKKTSAFIQNENLNSPKPKILHKLKEDQETHSNNLYNKMFLKIIKFSWCYFLTFLSFYLVRTINLIFLGHVDIANNIFNINVIQIGHIYTNIFGAIFCIGTMQAFEFFGSKFYISKEYSLFMDVYSMAKICCVLIFLIIILPFSFCSQFFLMLFGVDENMAVHSSRYIKLHLITYAFTILQLLNTKFLQIIGHHSISMGINLISLTIHIISCFFFIYSLNLGYIGATISSGISSFVTYILTSFFVYQLRPIKTGENDIIFLNSDLLNTTKFFIYCRFGIINSLYNTVHDSSFELIVMLSYYIDNINFTSSGITLNYIALLYHFIIGFSVIIFNRVYKYLTQKKIQKTKTFMKNIIILTLGIASVASVVNFSLSHYIGYMYLNNPAVIENFAFLIKIYSVVIFFDWGNSIFNNFLKGFNRHADMKIISNLALMFIFIPIGILLAFTFKLGLFGLWYALYAYIITFCFVYGFSIYYIDLEKEQDQIVNSLKNYVESEDIFFR